MIYSFLNNNYYYIFVVFTSDFKIVHPMEIYVFVLLPNGLSPWYCFFPNSFLCQFRFHMHHLSSAFVSWSVGVSLSKQPSSNSCIICSLGHPHRMVMCSPGNPPASTRVASTEVASTPTNMASRSRGTSNSNAGEVVWHKERSPVEFFVGSSSPTVFPFVLLWKLIKKFYAKHAFFQRFLLAETPLPLQSICLPIALHNCSHCNLLYNCTICQFSLLNKCLLHVIGFTIGCTTGVVKSSSASLTLGIQRGIKTRMNFLFLNSLSHSFFFLNVGFRIFFQTHAFRDFVIFLERILPNVSRTLHTCVLPDVIHVFLRFKSNTPAHSCPLCYVPVVLL